MRRSKISAGPIDAQALAQGMRKSIARVLGLGDARSAARTMPNHFSMRVAGSNGHKRSHGCGPWAKGCR
jgi:hypothetical protein